MEKTEKANKLFVNLFHLSSYSIYCSFELAVCVSCETCHN